MPETELYKLIAEHLWQVLLGVGGFISAVILILYKKINNTYTKDETLQMIDLKVVPLIDSLDRHGSLIEKQTKVLERLNDSIQILHRDMSVVKVKVESLEGRRKDD